MTRNLGSWDRALRVVGSLALLTCSLFAPLSAPVRVAALALPGFLLLGTALLGSCPGYKLLGRSSCGLPPARHG